MFPSRRSGSMGVSSLSLLLVSPRSVSPRTAIPVSTPSGTRGREHRWNGSGRVIVLDRMFQWNGSLLPPVKELRPQTTRVLTSRKWQEGLSVHPVPLRLGTWGLTPTLSPGNPCDPWIPTPSSWPVSVQRESLSDQLNYLTCLLGYTKRGLFSLETGPTSLTETFR